MNIFSADRLGGALLSCRGGAIAVEMGLLAPVAAAILIGLFEYVGAIQQSLRLTNAARAGVEYATKYPSDAAGIEQTIVDSGAIDSADLSVAVAQFCECPDGTSIACTDSCAGGVQSNVFMRVSLAQPARSVLASSGLMSNYMVTANATLRVR